MLALPYEVWRDIDWIESIHYYQISNRCGVRRLQKNGKWSYIKPFKDEKGYMNVHICYQKYKSHKCKIHRLVAQAFIPNPDNKPEVDHINTIRDDNRIENLRWVTGKENCNNLLSKQHLKENFYWYGKSGKLSPTAIPVLQFDLNGNLVKEWDCAADVEREIGIKRTNISSCCKGKSKSAGGYIWRYA